MIPRILLAGLLFAQPFMGAAKAQTVLKGVSVSMGGAAWHGDFGAPTDTTISSALFGVRYRTGGLRLSASIPWMRIESDGSFFAGIGGTPLFVAPNVRSPDRVRKGWGDVTLGASYLLPGADARGFDIDLSARVKVPTATNSSGLSTGKADYSAGVEASKAIGRVTPSASVTYRWFGDNRTWSFHNGFDVTAGASYALTDRVVILANYEFTERSSDFIRSSHELVLGASTPFFTDKLRISAYGAKGLSNGAADVSGGASLTFAF